MTKVREMMTPGVHLVRPDQTLADAAKIMADADVGSLPVGEGDRLVGMLTDRDVVVRGLALDHDAGTRVREVMTDEVKYCFDDEDVSHVARNMADLGVRRLPVVDRNKRLVGIMSLSNVAQGGDGGAVNEMLRGVAVPH